MPGRLLGKHRFDVTEDGFAPLLNTESRKVAQEGKHSTHHLLAALISLCSDYPTL